MRAALLDPAFRQRIRNSLFGMGVNADSIDDATQNVMLVLLSTKASVADVNAYAWGVARNVARMEIERRITYRAKYADVDIVGYELSVPGPDVLTRLIRRQRLGRAQRILRTLPARPREILTRAYVHGQGLSEICGAMAISPTVLRVEKHRAKAQFLDRVAAQRVKTV